MWPTVEIVDHLALGVPINSVSLDSDGDRAAIAAGDQEISLCSVSQRRLVREESFPLPPFRQPAASDEIHFRETTVALADEHTLLVARTATRVTPYDCWVQLTAIDLATKQVRGYFRTSGLDGLTARGGLAPYGPHHALLAVGKTVLCMDLQSFKEVCRARQIDELGDVAEPGAFPDEHLAPSGFAFDPEAGRVYLLCAIFGEAFLLRYRLEAHP